MGEQVSLLHADFTSSELCPGVGGLDHTEEFWRAFSKLKDSYCLRSVNCCTTSWVVRKLPWILSLPCANWWVAKTKEKPNEHAQCALWVTATGMDLEDTELRRTSTTLPPSCGIGSRRSHRGWEQTGDYWRQGGEINQRCWVLVRQNKEFWCGPHKRVTSDINHTGHILKS